MTRLIRLSVFIILLLSAFSIAYGQQKLTGSYTMIVSGQIVSNEKYTVTVDEKGNIEAEGDVEAGPNKIHTITKATKTRPQSFAFTLANHTGSTVTFDGNSAKISTSGQEDREVNTQATVILENGVWHQLIFLLKQYDVARGGSQTFLAFMPSQSAEMKLDLDRTGSPTLDVKGEHIATERFRATTSQGIVFDLWTDKDLVPLVISVPTQSVKVVRTGSEQLAEILVPKPKPSVRINNFTSEEVSFVNGDVKLAGTVTLPKTGKAPFPAAVIITGSGSQDRDGATGVFDLYRLVAEYLSNAGVAVLRADDRGVGKSVMPDPKRPTSYRDLINDSRAAFEYLAQRSDIDKTRIALVGHSEGAETALTLAAEDPRVAAIVLLAGAAHPVDRVALEQSIYQAALQRPTDPSDRNAFPQVARIILQRFEAARKETTPVSGPDPDAWFREHIHSDPSALARRVKCPVLILNGERDSLVLAHNAIELAQALIAGGNKQVRLRIFPNLTHSFTAASVERSAPAEQLMNVSTEMLETVSAWASATLAAK
jgi:dipeptidyl aminopeptidase/acylaminoacyl peptidase